MVSVVVVVAAVAAADAVAAVAAAAVVVAAAGDFTTYHIELILPEGRSEPGLPSGFFQLPLTDFVVAASEANVTR